MTPDMNINNEMIISALRGATIVGLMEGWSFRIEEVAPYVFKSYGECVNHDTVIGHGGTAEDALMDCIRKAKKVNLHEQRGIKLEKTLSKIRDAIKNILNP